MVKKSVLPALCAACAIFLLSGMGEDGATGRVESALGLRLAGQAKAVRSMDSHGGFHGDGLTYIELELLDSEGLETALDDAPGWHSLPLSEAAETVFYGIERGAYAHTACVPEGVRIPAVADGFWRLIDRQEGEPEHIFDASRYSCNFTAALVDFDRSRLYFLELDT